MVIKLDLVGKVCPFPIIQTLKEFPNLKSGEVMEVKVDDPLAIKSIPEELENQGADIATDKIDEGWKITIKKR